MIGSRATESDFPLPDPGVLRALALVAVGAGVLGNIVYALTDGRTRVLVTVFSVLALFAAALLHAASESPRALGAVLVACVCFGFFAEFVGDRLGFPFGAYAYTKGVWMQFLGVPLVVPMAWAMLGWPAFVAGRFFGKPLLGAPILAAWDLFLDPQMVEQGHWSWSDSWWPRINGIPLSNTLGWLLVGALMMLLLDLLVDQQIQFEGIPFLVLAWTWFSSIVGHLVFFGSPAVAFIGGVAFTAALAPVALAFKQVMGRSSRGSGGGGGQGPLSQSNQLNRRSNESAMSSLSGSRRR
jgi:uncharacterized membrane protein